MKVNSLILSLMAKDLVKQKMVTNILVNGSTTLDLEKEFIFGQTVTLTKVNF